MCQLGGLWSDRCSQKVKNISHSYYDFGLNQNIAVYQGLNSIIADINWVNVVWHSIMQSSVQQNQPEFAVFFISCVTFMEAKAVMTTSLWASSYFSTMKTNTLVEVEVSIEVIEDFRWIWWQWKQKVLGRRDWGVCVFRSEQLVSN